MMTMNVGNRQDPRPFINDLGPDPTLCQQFVTLIVAGALMGVIAATLAYLDLL